MRVKNFDVNTIDAERYISKGEKRQNIQIDHNISITDVDKIDQSSDDVSFRFTVSYTGMGEIRIEGDVTLDETPSNLAQEWKETQKIPDEVKKTTYQVVINNCVPESVGIARAVNLPPPIPLPSVNISKQEEKKPSSGMEVA